MSAAKPKSFAAALERLTGRLGWVIARVPFDVLKTWGTRRPKVKGEINGFRFRSTLFPARSGDHFVLVNKRMLRGSGTVAGSMAKFRLEPDTEERTVSLTSELRRSMAGDRALLRWYEALNYSTRKYIADWITEVKSGEARVRRADCRAPAGHHGSRAGAAAAAAARVRARSACMGRLAAHVAGAAARAVAGDFLLPQS